MHADVAAADELEAVGSQAESAEAASQQDEWVKQLMDEWPDMNPASRAKQAVRFWMPQHHWQRFGFGVEDRRKEEFDSFDWVGQFAGWSTDIPRHTCEDLTPDEFTKRYVHYMIGMSPK